MENLFPLKESLLDKLFEFGVASFKSRKVCSLFNKDLCGPRLWIYLQSIY